jgi:hypothetical protein
LPSTGHGRLPARRSRTGHRAIGGLSLHGFSLRHLLRRRSSPDDGRRWNEILSSATVILAGVLLVVGFGFVASKAMGGGDHAEALLPEPAPPALGDITLPPETGGGLIPLGSPSPSSSKPAPPPVTTTPAKPATTPPDPGALSIARGAVPSVVDLSGEGKRDWVHWGEKGTFSLERDKKGGFAILEGAPTAPRFKHALSAQRFRWTGGDPVDHSDGTPTGIRTCGAGNGFTLTAPSGTGARVLKLYVGVVSGTGRLEANLSTGKASASATLEEPTGALRTAVLTVTYRAPKAGLLRLKWTTAKAVGKGCGGVALEAATLR